MAVVKDGKIPIRRPNAALLWAFVLVGNIGLPQAQIAGPTLEECGPSFPDYPELIEPLRPPDTITKTYALGLAGAPVLTVTVAEGESIQSAVDRATPGSRIVLDADEFRETVVVAVHAITFESAPGRTVRWVGEFFSCCPPSEEGCGNPALIVDGARDILLQGLRIEGSRGFSRSISSFSGFDGGVGGPAVVLQGNASVALIACDVRGGGGGDGEPLDTCTGLSVGSGGNGAAGILVSLGSIARADSGSIIRGGTAGFSASTEPANLAPPDFPACCIFAAPHGSHALPVEGQGEFVWVEFRFPTTDATSWMDYE